MYCFDFRKGWDTVGYIKALELAFLSQIGFFFQKYVLIKISESMYNSPIKRLKVFYPTAANGAEPHSEEHDDQGIIDGNTDIENYII